MATSKARTLWQVLEGKKTFIICMLGAIVTVAYAFGYIDLHAYTILSGLLVPGGLAALRSGQRVESAKVMESSQDDADKVIDSAQQDIEDAQ